MNHDSKTLCVSSAIILLCVTSPRPHFILLVLSMSMVLVSVFKVDDLRLRAIQSFVCMIIAVWFGLTLRAMRISLPWLWIVSVLCLLLFTVVDVILYIQNTYSDRESNTASVRGTSMGRFRSEPEPQMNMEVETSLAHISLTESLRDLVTNGGNGRLQSTIECCICLEEIESWCEDAAKRATALECVHVFHRACISEWRSSRLSCPVCMHNSDLSA